ncbi:hypothetical protein ACSFA8_24765 [Variovorax sp. RT4R15]|uniref:hypothetical protein n=1 Tax=Variovorax sp. RT4R15 TaxID=3443737 RepID=UPI003F48071B
MSDASAIESHAAMGIPASAGVPSPAGTLLPPVTKVIVAIHLTGGECRRDVKSGLLDLTEREVRAALPRSAVRRNIGTRDQTAATKVAVTPHRRSFHA